MKNKGVCLTTIFWADGAEDPVTLMLPDSCYKLAEAAAQNEQEGRLHRLGSAITLILDKAGIDYHEKYYPQNGPDEARLNITFSDSAGTSYFVTIYNEMAARCTSCTANPAVPGGNVVAMRASLTARAIPTRRFGPLGAMLVQVGKRFSH